MRTVHVLVPDSVDDPARPSGGNTYDRRVCAGLQQLGWDVRLHALPGQWPHPGCDDAAGLSRALDSVPRDAVVLVDGLVASGHPDLLVPAAQRLRLVVLVHLPLGHPLAQEAGPDVVDASIGAPVGAPPRRAEDERLVLDAAAAVVATSGWTADWLTTAYRLDPGRLHVAWPGADPAPPATGTTGGGALLSVAAVVPAKGHAELLDALASLGDLPWRLVCAGAVDLAPDHVARLRARCREAGISDRVRFAGPLGSRALDREYAAADLLVVASRIETFGLVVTEALARALPVVATAVGGIEEAMGTVANGRPGVLVHAGADDLAVTLRAWLEDAGLRHRLQSAARERRSSLAAWSATALVVSGVLSEVAAVNRSDAAYVGVSAGPHRAPPDRKGAP